MRLLFFLIVILPSCHKPNQVCEEGLYASILNEITKPYEGSEIDKSEFDSEIILCLNFSPSTINADYWPTIKSVFRSDFEHKFSYVDSIGVRLSLRNIESKYELYDIDTCLPKTDGKRQIIVNLSKGYFDTTQNKGVLLYRVLEGKNSGFEGISVFERKENCWHIIKFIDIGVY